MENDIKELIGNFSGLIEELKEKQDKIESLLNNVLSGADEAYNDWDHNKKKSAFSERNKEFLDKYSDKLKKIEGDDFDLAEEAMSGITDDIDEAQYIAALSSSIDEQLDKLREALGAAEVKVDTNPETTEIEADGEKVADVADEVNEDKSETDAEPESEDKPEETAESEDKPEEVESDNSPEEIENLRKELESYK